MTETYFKAVRQDGTDFRTGTINYDTGQLVRHPDLVEGALPVQPDRGSRPFDNADAYLSISTTVTDCTGMGWPARVLEVEAVGPVWTPHASSLPNKRACLVLRAVGELNPVVLLGPQGAEVEALIERSKQLTYAEARGLAAAWDAARAAAGDAARAAAWDAARAAAGDAARAAARAAAGDAARAAAWDAARAAAGDAAGAAARAAAGVLTRDLIGASGYTQEHYDLLTGPWRRVIGRLHPADEDLRTGAVA